MSNNKLIGVLIIFLIIGTIPLSLGASNQNCQTQGILKGNGSLPASIDASNKTYQKTSHHAFQHATSSFTSETKKATASVVRTANRVDIFWIGTNGEIWTNSLIRDKWGKARRITDDGVAQSNGGIAAVARTSNDIDIFWIGNDGGIWNKEWTAGKWSKEQEITTAGVAQTNGIVTAVARTTTEVDVFWIGTDGLVWTNVGTGSSGTPLLWGSEGSITTASSAAETDAVVAAVARNNNLDIFWIDNSGNIWNKQWSAGTWGIEHAIFIGSVADPGAGISAVARTPQEVHVFWITNLAGASGSVLDLKGISVAAGGPLTWVTLNAITPIGVAQTDALVSSDSRAPQTMGIFWIDNSGGIWTETWSAGTGTWGAPRQIAGRGSTMTDTGVEVIDRSPLISDIFWKSSDGRIVFTSSFKNNIWSPALKISWR